MFADTAQVYRNEAEAGQAFKESGLARDDVFITTKWSGLGGLDIQTSIQNSLKNVRIQLSDQSGPALETNFFYLATIMIARRKLCRPLPYPLSTPRSTRYPDRMGSDGESQS